MWILVWGLVLLGTRLDMTRTNSRYEIFLADTQEAKRKNYQLRYRVFCAEKGWEDTSNTGNDMEFDPFDDFSAHLLARDRFSGEWVGGVRMIMLPVAYLPISRLCDIQINSKHSEPLKCAEISRLFIVPGSRDGGHSSGEIVLRLIWAAREYLMRRGLKGWYMLIQPSFERQLRRLGLDFFSCGDGVEYKGWRKPYCGDFEESFRVICDRMQASGQLSAQSYALYSGGGRVDKNALLNWHSLISDKRGTNTSFVPAAV